MYEVETERVIFELPLSNMSIFKFLSDDIVIVQAELGLFLSENASATKGNIVWKHQPNGIGIIFFVSSEMSKMSPTKISCTFLSSVLLRSFQIAVHSISL